MTSKNNTFIYTPHFAFISFDFNFAKYGMDLQERLPLPISKVNPKAKKQTHFYLNGPQKVRHQLKNLSLCGETKMVSGKVSRLPPFVWTVFTLLENTVSVTSKQPLDMRLKFWPKIQKDGLDHQIPTTLLPMELVSFSPITYLIDHFSWTILTPKLW